MSVLLLLVGNDQIVELPRLYEHVSGDPVNDATVTAVIKDRSGVELASVSMPYVTDTDGTYRGVIEDGVPLVAGRTYMVTVNAVAPGDLAAQWGPEAIMAVIRPLGVC